MNLKLLTALVFYLVNLITFTLPSSVVADTELVSVSSGGIQGDAFSAFPALSHDGRFVAFVSKAENLVAGDTNEEWDVFVHERETGETRRVSVASDGTEANGISGYGPLGISGDGQSVVFVSMADNLVPDDNNRALDIFIHDTQTSLTERVSIGSDGTEANGASWGLGISADGRFVVFESFSDNLVPGDTNGHSDIFVHDRETGLTSRVNVASDGTEANAGNTWYWAYWHSYRISNNGRYVAFNSLADNLVPGDENGTEDVFIHDRHTGVTQMLSVSSTGDEGNGLSLLYDMSADGRFVIFYTNSSNLSNDGDGGLLLHDRDTGKTTEIPGHGWFAAISDDGRHVAFSSFDNNLVAWEDNTRADVYVIDLQTERISRVNTAYNGGKTNHHSYDVAISGDGKYVSFASRAENLVRDDTNGVEDVFLTENPHLFTINLGLNDAWQNPNTPGQSFWITVYPESGKMKLAWLTFDTELAADDAAANFGAPGQRWVTATGEYLDNQAFMLIEVTSGGVFNELSETQRTSPPGTGGAVILTFSNCSSASIEYYISSVDRIGRIPIRRITDDNVEICEALNKE